MVKRLLRSSSPRLRLMQLRKSFKDTFKEELPRKPFPVVRTHQFLIGCDPELFFIKNGEVVGSEKVIRAVEKAYADEWQEQQGLESGQIIQDGIQVELNPKPDHCRDNLGRNLSRCFQLINKKLKDGISAKVSCTETITKQEMDSLSEKSKTLGCSKSNNVYKGESASITVSGSEYSIRSCGGHIHLGGNGGGINELVLPAYKPENISKLIKVLDIIVGNTCVLVDRDPANKVRREVYGRAGEFRIPAHGIEYRTLSNFWLRSFTLYSMVMGLARHATMAVAMGMADDIIALVDMKDIEKAINNNDFNLALKNFEKVKSFFMESTDTAKMQNIQGYSWGHGYFAINKVNYEQFLKFIEKPMDDWFPEDPIQHWTNLSNGGLTPKTNVPRHIGFNNFLLSYVKQSNTTETR